ncbi:MAG: diphthine--ammonia ligase [Sphingobacteriales bacterium]|nr:diphthine--ammonia ligase [Sphingobacteriales bacterium]MBI3718798.1 diphthine--ammonia ligase [Sphingobacteriales bacterium]
MIPAIFNWSGGKDSTLALHRVLAEKKFDVKYLLTTLSEKYQRISMHGVREALLKKQAAAIGIPLKKIYLPENASMITYNEIMEKTMTDIASENIHNAIFGDIFLEDLKKYREEQLSKVGFTAHFPLWKEDSKVLLNELLRLGYKTILVCVNEKQLNENFAGRVIDQSFIDDLPATVDPCGENGEFHTFVFEGPIFTQPISFTKGEVVRRNYVPTDDDDCFSNNPQPYDTGFYYCDLIPA